MIITKMGAFTVGSFECCVERLSGFDTWVGLYISRCVYEMNGIAKLQYCNLAKVSVK